jgi:putative RNA 2'-phosphotransferase
MKSELVSRSKFLSLVLRHKPEEIGLVLDEHGWANVQELLSKTKMTFVELQEIVDTNDKKRFAFNEDKTKIRASQGHSIDIELDLNPVTPPDVLYHGTATRFWDSISQTGLEKRSRQHVHLSSTEETAYKVGIRHGKPLILVIDSKSMHQKGYVFYLSANGVWLTDHVPREFISITLRSVNAKLAEHR